MSQSGRDLAAVDGPLHEDAVDRRARLDDRRVRRLGEFGRARQHRHQPGHDLQLLLAVFDRVRLDHRDEVAAQGSGVGKLRRVEVDLLHAGDGVDDEFALGRPAAVQRWPCRPSPGRRPCRWSCRRSRSRRARRARHPGSRDRGCGRVCDRVSRAAPLFPLSRRSSVRLSSVRFGCVIAPISISVNCAH